MPDITYYDHPYDIMEHLAIALARPTGGTHTSPISCNKAIQFGSGLKYIRGWENWDWKDWDAETGEPIPIDSDSIDAIACYNTMDHLSEPIRVLAEFQRILRPGGYIVIVVPHYSSELWHTDLTHKSQFGIDTWRNIFSERHYTHKGVVAGHVDWELDIAFSMLMGLTERNLMLVTKMVKRIPER